MLANGDEELGVSQSADEAGDPPQMRQLVTFAAECKKHHSVLYSVIAKNVAKWLTVKFKSCTSLSNTQHDS